LLEVGAISVTITGIMLGYEGIRRMWGDKSDLKLIGELFENINFGIKRNGEMEYPKLINKDIGDEKKMYDTYIYTLPLGIKFSLFKMLEEHLTDGIGRDVKIESGERIAKIRVAREVLGDKIPLAPFLGKTKGWKVLIGVNAFEAVTHDFEAYPMVVGGGATRFGKTVFMKNVMTQLILQNPDDIEIYIIDLKGGLEFKKYKKIKQVVDVVDNPIQAFKLLGSLAGESDSWLSRRFELFDKEGYNDITKTPIRKRTFLIVDETHDLFKNTDPRITNQVKKKIENYMARLAAMGGGLGFRMLAFTQYPVKEAMPQFVKQNAPVRIGFQTADGVASRVIMDQDGLQDLPGIPGRCMVKSFKYTTVQVPWYLNHYDLVKQYEVIKDEPEHGTKIDEGNRDTPINRQAIVPK